MHPCKYKRFPRGIRPFAGMCIFFGSISSVGAQNDRHGSDPTANADVDAVDCELKRMRREADCLRTLRDSVEDE